MQPKIVILDGFTMNPGDLDWSGIESLGKVEVYDRTSPKDVWKRAKDAEIIIVNKVIIDGELLTQLPKLKCICVTATGYNNIDTHAAAQKGIPVCNVRGYSTHSVAQHVFAMILELTNYVGAYNESVQDEAWTRSPDFCYLLGEMPELYGKTLGIYGFGQIGQAVANIALAFGMKVIAKHKHPERDRRSGVEFVDATKLFRTSDVVSLHAPLTHDNTGLINLSLLKTMKSNALLINTARGGFVVEEDLKFALENKIIAGAALDVLTVEPPVEPLVLKGVKNCLLTPHVAWASKAARQRLMDETIKNVKFFLQGTSARGTRVI